MAKIDMQGYECEFFKSLAKTPGLRIQTAKMEIASKWLEDQNCSAALLKPLVDAVGLVQHSPAFSYAPPKWELFDLVASREMEIMVEETVL